MARPRRGLWWEGGAQPGSKEVSRESHRLLWVGQGYFIWPAHTYTCIPPGSETEARMPHVQSCPVREAQQRHHSLTLIHNLARPLCLGPGCTIHIYYILPSKSWAVSTARVLLKHAWPSRGCSNTLPRQDLPRQVRLGISLQTPPHPQLGARLQGPCEQTRMVTAGGALSLRRKASESSVTHLMCAYV